MPGCGAKMAYCDKHYAATLERSQKATERSAAMEKLADSNAEVATEALRRVDALEKALGEAIDLAKEGWSYAAPYFQEKWRYQERLDALDAVGLGSSDSISTAGESKP